MRIAFVGFTLHQKSRSEEFFVSILERQGIEVQRFWSEGWQGGDDIAIKDLADFSAVIMWQVTCRAFKPYALYCDNITFVPMLDNHIANVPAGLEQLRHDRDYWQMFGETKILSFSKALHDAMSSLGICSRHFQCYTPPAPKPVQRQGLHGFFWLRREDVISLDIVGRLTEGTRFDSIHVHIGSDTGGDDFVMPESWRGQNVTVSTWFDDVAQYKQLLAQKNVFFAPRPVEGIGFSFLEAMSLGHCVVAPDFPTMNEYMRHGENGLLYDLRNPQPLCFDDAQNIGLRAWESIKQGHEEWLSSQEQLVEYILTPNAKAYAAWPGSPLPARMPLKRKFLNITQLRPFFRFLSRCKALLKHKRC